MALPFYQIMGGLMPDADFFFDAESGKPIPPTPTATPRQTTVDGYDITSPSLAPAPSGYTAPGGETFENVNDYINFINTGKLPTDPSDETPPNPGGSGNNNAYLQFLKDQAGLELDSEIGTARNILEVLLRQLFVDADDAFIKDIMKQAEPDIKMQLPGEIIIAKLQNYDDPNSAFSKRFAGNVKLKKEGMQPLSPSEYLQQEQRYGEALSTRGLGELATRANFSEWVGGRVSPFELEDRIVKGFDPYDNADASLKVELQNALGLDPLSTRTAVAKALLMGEKGAAELQRRVRTAEVGVEARTRGLDVTAADELARMGVTREQARAGFEQIRLTQPRLTQLSEMYTRETPDTLGLQRELEAEQFQGMQSQRRRRLAEQETAAFMGQSGTASGISLNRRRTGQI